VLTNLIFASFTFIFFALEGSIMAQGLNWGSAFHWAWAICCRPSCVALVIYGMKALAKLQVWTTPLWLVMMVGPFIYLVAAHPDSVGKFLSFSGVDSDGAPLGKGVSWAGIMLCAGVCLS
jgi:hypothetical protein